MLCLDSCGLRRSSEGWIVPMDVLDPLLVPMQKENHGTTELDHQHQTETIME